MNETIILVAVISNMVLTPIIQYMLSSRCSEIDCCCIKCKRQVIEMNIEDINTINNQK